MAKRLLLIMIGLLLLSGLAVAQAPAPQRGTLPFFWVTGKVTNTENLGGRPVVLYMRTFDLSKSITAEVGADGSYRINLFELYYYHYDDNFSKGNGGPYFLSVVRDDEHSYGTLIPFFPDFQRGYTGVNLTLEADSGPKIGKGVVLGRVFDAITQAPIAGATVTLTAEGFVQTTVSSMGVFPGIGELAVFSFDDVTPETYTLTCTANGYSPSSESGIRVSANEISGAEFALIPAGAVGAISGEVTDADTGAPIAGAVITIEGFSVTSEADGSYAIPNIPTGTYIVICTAEGYIGASSSESVAGGETKTVNFALVPLLIVINTADSGPGSLRGVINYANLHSGPDTITFNIPTSDSGYTTEAGVSWWRIQPTSEALPFLTGEGTVIDGTTQKIEINGANLANGSGLIIHANNCIIKGLAIKQFRDSGVVIERGAKNNTIGGSTDADRNIVSGNTGGHGIFIEGMGTDSNIIKGNYIIGNGLEGVAQGAGHAGIAINDANSTEVQGNVISGNGTHGIQIADASETLITGNRIGIDKNGSAMGNGGDGVSIGATTESNTVGPNNIIAHNTNSGVYISGADCIKNTITQNRMFSNGGLGIGLADGGNGNIGYPTIVSENYNPSTGSTEVVGTAEASATVEVFLVEVPEDPSGFGEGRTYEASTISGDLGNWSITISGLNPGDRVTATVTKDRNTSEFALNKEITLPAITIGTIEGSVSTEAGAVIEGAVVTLEAEGKLYAASSGADGLYRISDIPAGTYTVTCSKAGYQSATQGDVHITSGQTTTLNFQLVLEVVEGPELTLTVLLQGFYGGGSQVQTDVLVEARKVREGVEDIPANATEIVGSTTITLNQDNNTKGANRFGAALGAGNYYLVIKHIKNNIPIHLPVISGTKLAIPGIHDFSTTDLSYTPPDKTEKAMREKEGKFLLWVGDMNGDKMVEESDFTVWLQKRRLDQSNPVADLNGDKMVDESDFTLWLESRRGIGKQTGNQSYVP